MKRTVLAAVTASVLATVGLATPAHAASASSSSNCTIQGTSRADVLRGTPGNDVICGLGGNDRLIGGGGDDMLIAGSGTDTLDGGAGADTLIGGAGSDTVTYASRTTSVRLDLDGAADDGAAGEKDRIKTDVEKLVGGTGNDVLQGNGAQNTLVGGLGSDTLEGGAGSDHLRGSAGSDVVLGGPGADVIDTGRGAAESANGNDGVDSCIDPDASVASPSNCEANTGWGVYGRVTLTPPDIAGPGRSSGSARQVFVAQLSGGQMLAIAYNARDVPMLTKLDEHGNVVTAFGRNGWVTDIAEGAGYGYVQSIRVIDDEIYVFFNALYVLKLDSDGQRVTSFGQNGLLSLAAVANPSRPDLDGMYRPRVLGTEIAIPYNTMLTDNGSYGWESGIFRVDTTGALVSHLRFAPGLLDGDLPHDILPLAGGGALELSTTGAVYGYDGDLTPDHNFGENGVVAAPTDSRLDGDPARIRSRLIETADGWSRLSITGVLKPDDRTGVPKVDEMQPQHLLQENFTDAGTDVAGSFGWPWDSTMLPFEGTVCDSAAAGVHSADTTALDALVAGELVPVDRCTDTVWVRADGQGTGTAISRAGTNTARTSDMGRVPLGDVLAYTDLNGLATLDLLD